MQADAPRVQLHRPRLRELFGHGGTALDYEMWGSVHTVIRYVNLAVLLIVHVGLTSYFEWEGGMIVAGYAVVYGATVVPLTTRRRRLSAVPGLVTDLSFLVLVGVLSGSPTIAIGWITAQFVLAMGILDSRDALRVSVYGVAVTVAGVAFGSNITSNALLEPRHLALYSVFSFAGSVVVVFLAMSASGARANRREQRLALAREELEREHLHQSTLFGALPIPVLEIDASAAVERFSYLRKEGISELSSEFDANPARLDALIGNISINAANSQGADLVGVPDLIGPLPVHTLSVSVKELLGKILSLVWDRHARSEFEIDIERDGQTRSFSVTLVNPGARTFAFDRLIVTAVDSTEVLTMLRRLERAKNELEATNHELGSTQAALLQSQKMEAIGVLAAGIAHEINTPIQYVGDNVRFLGESTADVINLLQAASRVAEEYADRGDPFVDALQTAVERADVEFLIEEMPMSVAQALDGVSRVAEIIRAMKDFAHPGNEEPSTVDVNHSVSSTAIVSQSEWKYVAELETILDPNLPPVPAFSGPLNQVLLNLVVNATHAIAGRSEDGLGRIVLRTTFDEQFVTVSVSDSGTGMPPNVVEKIFDPFFTTKDVGKGTGQGLAIAHQVIVDRHRGRIDVETVLGEGTTFHVRLPRSVSEVAA